MPSTLTNAGLALLRLQGGVYAVKGEKDFTPRWSTLDKQREWGRAWVKRAKKNPEINKKLMQNQAKYRSTVPPAKRRPWEAWEIEFLEKHKHLPARLIAFALQRGIQAVQFQRMGPGKNAERVRQWRLKRKKQGSPKATKRRT